jgi:predicted nucleic acid-binding protein
MAVKVVDASALAALLFGEPEGEAMAARLEGHALVAPSLLWFEMTSICLKKMRRHAQDHVRLAAAFHLLPGLAIESVAVDLRATLDLALDEEITAYDAAYLWLARRLGAELVTLDHTLMAAWAGR